MSNFYLVDFNSNEMNITSYGESTMGSNGISNQC
jgi:hypothetical protein